MNKYVLVDFVDNKVKMFKSKHELEENIIKIIKEEGADFFSKEIIGAYSIESGKEIKYDFTNTITINWY